MKNMIGVVVIGRNEGDRLIKCLNSVMPDENLVVYVDSASSDSSIANAIAKRVEVVELDMSIPFSAARARNEGYKRLIEINPNIEFVQFVDGDCELVSGWLDQASIVLKNNPDTAIVCGRRRERYPSKTIYNYLCDLEWDTLVGEAKACGGDFLVKSEVFQAVGGFNPAVIAGEEPEMCFRLRSLGWKIERIDCEMTLHDAAMTRFSQWWKRAVRGGHAYAQGKAMHGKSSENYYVKEYYSIIFWASVIHFFTMVLAIFSSPVFLLIFFLYPLQVLKITYNELARRKLMKDSFYIAFFSMLAKFPQLIGIINFHKSRITNRKLEIIEYK